MVFFPSRSSVVSGHILWSFFTFVAYFYFDLNTTSTQPTHNQHTQPTHNQHTTNIQPTHYQHQHTTNIQPKHNQHITNKHTTNTQPYTTNLALCYLFSFLQVPAEDPVRRSLILWFFACKTLQAVQCFGYFCIFGSFKYTFPGRAVPQIFIVLSPTITIIIYHSTGQLFF